MTYIIIGNIIALIASILMVYLGIVKSKKKIIYIQTIQIALSVVSNIVLGGITGAIINSISCVRNILCYKDKLHTKETTIIIILSILIPLIFNSKGIIGIFPIIGTVTYTALMNIKNVIKFKYLLIFTMIMWFIYDFSIMSYSSALFDLLNVVSNFIGIYRIKRQNKKNIKRV